MIEYPIEHPRTLVVSTPDFDCSTNMIELGPDEHMMFGHIDVYRFGPSVLKELLRLWPEVRKGLPQIIFTMGQTPGRKFHNFVSLLGFIPINDAPCTDGRIRTIYAHFKD